MNDGAAILIVCLFSASRVCARRALQNVGLRLLMYVLAMNALRLGRQLYSRERAGACKMYRLKASLCPPYLPKSIGQFV